MLTSTYGSDIYVIAAYFDPRFKFQWVESFVKLNQEQLQTLVAELNIIVRSFVESTNAFYKRVTSSSAKDAGASTSSTADAGCEPPPTKKSKLFATCTTAKSNCTDTTLASVAAQMNKYSSIECEYDPSFDCISFLKEHSQLLDKLYFPAIRALGVPASSSPIERVFSKGGLIMRPLRSKMSHSRVSELIFLKCHSSV